MPDPASGGWRQGAKRLRAGRMAAALWRLRRAPASALRSQLADRSDRRAGRVPPPPSRRREVRSVVCIPAGPGSLDGLLDTIDSVLASDGDDSHVLVVDDASVDTREALVRERFPAVEVLRRPLPTGGPPKLWPMLASVIERALEAHHFEQLVKMDTDAVFCGPGFSQATLARFQAAPGAGMAGSCGVRCDGQPEDRRYHAEVLEREQRHDRLVAAAAARARDRGWPAGEIVQGGVFCLTRAACAEIARQGWLDWRRPWHSAISEDLATSLFVRAAGFELLSIGDPQGIFAVANKHLPLPVEEVASGPWVAAHSVRRGLAGERESDLRTALRARRAEWAPPVAG